jgi:hypothetical protein
VHNMHLLQYAPYLFSKVLLAWRDPLDLKVIKDSKDPLDLLVYLEVLEPAVPRVQQVLLEVLDNKERLVQRD